MKLVILESPFSGDVRWHQRYLRAAIRDCLSRGESPYASHRMLTDALDDKIPEQRNLGIQAGFAWRSCASLTVVYADLGISRGMQAGIDDAHAMQQLVEFRKLGGEWAQ